MTVARARRAAGFTNATSADEGCRGNKDLVPTRSDVIAGPATPKTVVAWDDWRTESDRVALLASVFSE